MCRCGGSVAGRAAGVDDGRAAGHRWPWSARPSRPGPPATLRAARGRRYDSSSFSHDPDLGLQRDTELALHTLACHVHEGGDVARIRRAPVDDEVGVLGRDLGAIEPLALQADLLDQTTRHLTRGVFPDAAGGGEGEGLRRLLDLEALLHLFLDLG